MYEMRAEPDPTAPEPVLMWHAVAPGDEPVTLCGRALAADGRSRPPSTTDDAPTDRYCSSCMAVVGEAMAEAERHR